MVLALIHIMITFSLGVFSVYLASILRRPACALNFVGECSLQFLPCKPCALGSFRGATLYLAPVSNWRDGYSLFPLLFCFALFGFASETQKQYKMVFHRFLKSLGLKYGISKLYKPSYWSRLVLRFFSARNVVEGYPSYNLTRRTDPKVQSEPCTPSPLTCKTKLDTLIMARSIVMILQAFIIQNKEIAFQYSCNCQLTSLHHACGMAYLRISKDSKYSFLLESVIGIGGENVARYSFITHSASGKASQFSLTSSDDTTLRIDLDIKKSSQLWKTLSPTVSRSDGHLLHIHWQ